MRKLTPLALLIIAAGLITEAGGLLALAVVVAVTCVASAGFLIRVLSRDRTRTWKPGDGDPEDSGDAPSVPIAVILSPPARPTDHIVARTPDDGYEATPG